jgi:hypothetical protein
VINAIKFSIEEIEASDQYFDHTTMHEIAAITGHTSLSEVQRYTKAADQARLARAAMEKAK